MQDDISNRTSRVFNFYLDDLVQVSGAIHLPPRGFVVPSEASGLALNVKREKHRLVMNSLTAC